MEKHSRLSAENQSLDQSPLGIANFEGIFSFGCFCRTPRMEPPSNEAPPAIISSVRFSAASSDSDRFRSSISVFTPYHLTIVP
jgi:hypothetical protein